MSSFTKYLKVDKPLAVGVLTNKGTIIKEVKTMEGDNLWVTDTIIDGETIDPEDDCFWPEDLHPIEPKDEYRKD